MSAKPAVAPVVATAVVVGVVNDDDGMVLNRAVPRGWTSGLCDCLNDCCSCFAVWCCTPITVAQLYVKLAYRGPESQAQVIFLAIASFLFARQVSEPGALLSPACTVCQPCLRPGAGTRNDRQRCGARVSAAGAVPMPKS